MLSLVVVANGDQSPCSKVDYCSPELVLYSQSYHMSMHVSVHCTPENTSQFYMFLILISSYFKF